MRRSTSFAFQCAAAFLVLSGPSWAQTDASNLVRAVREKVNAGTVAPETDLAALITALERTQSDSEAGILIDGIGDIGEADGYSPAAVKAYLREAATPVLLRVARGKFSHFERNAAVRVIHKLEADDAATGEAAQLAEAMTSEDGGLVQGLFLSWANSRRDEWGPSAPVVLQPKDKAREKQALALLKARSVWVRPIALTEAAGQARTDVVAALLDAGVPVQAGHARNWPIVSALWGCSADKGNGKERLRTIEQLVTAGADLKAETGIAGGTILYHAVDGCPLPVVKKVVELGAPVATDSSIALEQGLITGKWDIAEFLIDRGARISALPPHMVDRIRASKPTNPRLLALLKRALQ
jgi:hypothetical protein